MNSQVILEVRNLSKVFTQGQSSIVVLKKINLTVHAGQHVAIIGASGSGKSTLLHLLGGLDRPTEGEVILDGQVLSQLHDKQVGLLRNQKLGFVYQFHHLLAEFSALENVAMPLWIGRQDRESSEQQASLMLEAVGLGHRLGHRPAELSGGERQRAAVARALVNQPRIVLADEPTGNLDRLTAQHVFDLMMQLNRKKGAALIMVTHDLELAARADIQYQLRDGELHQIDSLAV
ncbi:MAG: lipoprotein releasing system, ATP-binding protein [Ferrovum sp. 37-45-19]|uniref:lipoprotein-releasing ABC transporter ATP-binding protein LolD n=1 Tax=Ferrovum sp. JA12 TaxID=1356299 RepID=UPI000702FB68|nr:lipoprotein-releasing ABC transporter ATP-binding protein LolD [Ferrovum sp. JA12]OYV79830.1 MAG: lipoprotein releasing system, ATP-binding protein [Ferrovum sp. 21-44-67]OYV95454.1 MAG: lipoprotein releasing system, ATP-binding protein [Ferrovum sp. 37-45-19]OZB31502.1 MAG: lipoprotein releasing system, ATP-binding protein [Ferrovum sp. 34-44-207]HQT81249.1 lipoprotein-releasing ABC transporter ATP-binding protein LolD [Ferrovaceae bacterium]KRH78136.1 lipoprotein-releasing system ATP-bind